MTWAFTHHLGALVRQSDPPILYLFLTYPVETLTSAGRTEDLRRTEGPASEEETVRTLTGMADQDGPYRQALGERAAALHPRLESYFSPPCRPAVWVGATACSPGSARADRCGC